MLENRQRKGATAEELESGLSDEWRQADVDEALKVLSSTGDAIAWRGRWYLPRFTDFEVGSVQVLERGDALIRSGAGGEAGYFVRRRNLKGAVDGDMVLLKRTGSRRRQREASLLPEAAIERVLARRYRRLVGTLEMDGQRRWLVPFDPKLNLEVVVEGGDELLEDQYVVVDLVSHPQSGRGPIRGRVIEVLGSPDVPGVDVEVVLRHFEIPDEFPPEVLAEAGAFPGDPEQQEIEIREDLRHKTVITIDGETARDFDDAISVHRLADGGFELGVHIADVSAYVRSGTGLDREAYRRGTSVYYPDRAIPMLPENLSNGLCSLRPEVPRLCLSAFLTLDRDGAVQKRRFAETVIRSTRRLTYEEVQRLLEKPRKSDPDRYGDVLELIRDARGLMKRLLERRMERGSIDFDLPEGDVVLDSEGFTVGVQPEKRTVAHRIIEEFMIAANEAVAAELMGHESPAIYRIHTAPSPNDLEELRMVLAGLGIRLKGDLEALHPSVLQDLLVRVEGRPEESFVSSMVLRSMQRAIYHPECRGHYALSSQHYLHFTSPIRRYPDLLVHRQLKRLLKAKTEEDAHQRMLAKALPAIAEHTSQTERRAEQSERVLLQWKLVRFLAERVGETFRGRITGVQPFGFFVQLTDYFVDGLVPVRSLTDDFYRYEAESHQLVGRSNRRRFRLADEIEVVLTGVDLRRRGLELRLKAHS